MQALSERDLVCTVRIGQGVRKGMSASFSTVGVISRRDSPEILDSVIAVRDCLVRNGVTVLLEDATARMLEGCANGAASRAELGERCDLIVAEIRRRKRYLTGR